METQRDHLNALRTKAARACDHAASMMVDLERNNETTVQRIGEA